MALNLKRIDLDFNEAGNISLLQCDGVDFAAAEPAEDAGLFIIQLRDFIAAHPHPKSADDLLKHNEFPGYSAPAIKHYHKAYLESL